MTATKWRLALAACFGMIVADPTAIRADEVEVTEAPAVEVEVDVDVALEEATPAEEGEAAEEAVVHPTHKSAISFPNSINVIGRGWCPGQSINH